MTSGNENAGSSWGWKVTLHVYGSGPHPSMSQISAASETAAAHLGADDFVGADVKTIRDKPNEQVAS